MKLKDWQLAVLVSLIVVVVAFVITQRTSIEDVPPPLSVEMEDQMLVPEEEIEEVMIPTTQEACEAAGGEWDACASPCEDGEVCITVCVEECRL